MEERTKTPLIRLAKRTSFPKPAAWAIRIGSILFALLLGCIVILLTGNNPFKAYAVMINGALGNADFRRQTVKIAVPLLGCALAIAPCFKMRFWNIGAEGQITAGALAATFVVRMLSSYFPGDKPARVCYQVTALPLGARVEIDAIAGPSHDDYFPDLGGE